LDSDYAWKGLVPAPAPLQLKGIVFHQDLAADTTAIDERRQTAMKIEEVKTIFTTALAASLIDASSSLPPMSPKPAPSPRKPMQPKEKQ